MKRLIGIFALTLSVGVTVFLVSAQEEPQAGVEATAPLHVKVQDLLPRTVTETVTGYGLVRPRWQSTLASGLQGTVLHVSEEFQAGSAFQEGEVLASLDPVAYRAAVASANSTLSTARRTLREEEQRATIAQETWDASGLSGTPSALALRKPQLEEAQAAVEAAEEALRLARHELTQAEIRAPFDGVVLERNINPGDFLQPGTVIGTIFDNRVLEVVVPLSGDEISRLAQPNEAQVVALTSRGSDTVWIGSIARIEQSINVVSRRQNVIVEISDALGLVPGQFLTAEFVGKVHQNVFEVPEHLLAKDGVLWVVDPQNKLQKQPSTPVFFADGYVYLYAPVDRSEMRVAEYRNGFLAGVVVVPLSSRQYEVESGQ